MSAPKPPKDYETTVREAAELADLPVGTATSIAQVIAESGVDGKRRSQKAIAELFGVPFGAISTVRNKLKSFLPEMRAQIVNKHLALADLAQNEAAKRLQDPQELAKVKTTDLVRIAVSTTAIANAVDTAPTSQDAARLTPQEVEAVRKMSEYMQSNPGLTKPTEKAVKALECPS